MNIKVQHGYQSQHRKRQFNSQKCLVTLYVVGRVIHVKVNVYMRRHQTRPFAHTTEEFTKSGGLLPLEKKSLLSKTLQPKMLPVKCSLFRNAVLRKRSAIAQ